MAEKILYMLSENDLDRICDKILKRRSQINLERKDSTDIPEDDRLTQTQAAVFLNKSVQTLIQWKKKRKIPFYQIEKSVFYSKSELLDMAKNNPAIFNRL